MGAITDLWKSERGLVAVSLIVAATVMFGLGKLTAEAWLDFAKWIAMIYIPAKTVTSAIDAYHAGKAAVAVSAAGGSKTAPNPASNPGPVLVPPAP